jgi:hypothetical protein
VGQPVQELRDLLLLLLDQPMAALAGVASVRLAPALAAEPFLGGGTPAVAPLAPLLAAALNAALNAALRRPIGGAAGSVQQAGHELDLHGRRARQRRQVMRERQSERQQFDRIRTGSDPQHIHLARAQAVLEREILTRRAALDASVDDHAVGGNGAARRGKRQILRGVVSRVETQQHHEIPKSLDESCPRRVHRIGSKRIHAVKLHDPARLDNPGDAVPNNAGIIT